MIILSGSMFSVQHSIALFFQNLMNAWSSSNWSEFILQERKKKKQKNCTHKFLIHIQQVVPCCLLVTPNLKYLISAMILLESKQTNDQLCNLGRLHDKLSFHFMLVFILRKCRTNGWRIGVWIIFLDQGSKLIVQANLHAPTFLITVSYMAILILKSIDKCD